MKSHQKCKATHFLSLLVVVSALCFSGCSSNQPPSATAQPFALATAGIESFDAAMARKSPPPTDKPPSFSVNDPNAASDINCRPKLAPALLTASVLDFQNGELVPGPVGAFTIDHDRIVLDANGTPKKVPYGFIATDSAGGKAVGPVVLFKADEKGYPILDANQAKVGMLQYLPGNPELLNRTKFAAVALPQHFVKQPLLDSSVSQVFNKEGEPIPYQASVASMSPYCQALSPLARLMFENAGITATTGYGNSAVYGNTLLKDPVLTTTSANTYLLGVGYTNKPILKQIRALFFPADSRYAVSKQGTFCEDVLFNAITVNASYGWGRQLEVKAGLPIDTYNSRPAYNVSVTYAVDLERLYVYALHGGSRPVDPGYYYGPTRNDFYKDTNQRFGIVPEDYSWPDKARQQ